MSAPLEMLDADQVRVAVEAYGLNFGDLLCVSGLYPTMPPYPFTPGFEAAGIVTDVGRDVSEFARGDEVIVVGAETLGCQATVVTCAAAHLLRKPPQLSFRDACSLPTVGITTLAAFEKAAVERGERILIHSAAGGVGLTAVALARHLELDVIATAGSPHKIEYLRALGVQHCIDYQRQDFEEEVLRLTGGEGVDVVLNSLPGDAIRKGLRCLAPGGRYVELAMSALKSMNAVDLSVLKDNQSFLSVDLRRLGRSRPQKIAHYGNELLELVKSGVIRPSVSQVFPLDSFREAHEYLRSRRSTGKVVVEIPESYRFRATSVSTEADSLAEKIAVIGVSARFPQSDNVTQLWEHLAAGDDLVTEVQRWTLPQTDEAGRPACRMGGFLTGIDTFDARFFNITDVEATYMDPQQRLFLEEGWNALEDAGCTGTRSLSGACGVYVGCTAGDYAQMFDGNAPAQALWGNASSVLAARISYHLDLKGPAVAVDTACSSSLVAIHLACQALRNREIDLALAGGVFLHCGPGFYRSATRAGMLSATGRCHVFDEAADGFVPGEGGGMVVLKRLREAVRDGDHIYGVIRGSAINQDGATNGITAPSALSQERLERHVYERFKVDPADIQYVEAHGTGTRLGDPIELDALTRAFRSGTEKRGYCAVGSIKANLGHTLTAAGVAGVIKILLSLQHRCIPPSLHYQVP
ncbi:MAG TPA: beta-ketoacyl synthase N-terminal-like domain-containing protein, partial [Steroidobacteraceae bacterium]